MQIEELVMNLLVIYIGQKIQSLEKQVLEHRLVVILRIY